jgi:hypothetical protein
MSQPTILERAFALARSGEFATITQLKVALRLEGYRERDIFGRALMGQLKALCIASRKPDSTVRAEPMW